MNEIDADAVKRWLKEGSYGLAAPYVRKLLDAFEAERVRRERAEAALVAIGEQAARVTNLARMVPRGQVAAPWIEDQMEVLIGCANDALAALDSDTREGDE